MHASVSLMAYCSVQISRNEDNLTCHCTILQVRVLLDHRLKVFGWLAEMELLIVWLDELKYFTMEPGATSAIITGSCQVDPE